MEKEYFLKKTFSYFKRHLGAENWTAENGGSRPSHYDLHLIWILIQNHPIRMNTLGNYILTILKIYLSSDSVNCSAFSQMTVIKVSECKKGSSREWIPFQPPRLARNDFRKKNAFVEQVETELNLQNQIANTMEEMKKILETLSDSKIERIFVVAVVIDSYSCSYNIFVKQYVIEIMNLMFFLHL